MYLENQEWNIQVQLENSNGIWQKKYKTRILNPLLFNRNDKYVEVLKISVRNKVTYKNWTVLLIGPSHLQDQYCAALKNGVLTVLVKNCIIQIDMHTYKVVRLRDLQTDGYITYLFQTRKYYFVLAVYMAIQLDDQLRAVRKFESYDYRIVSPSSHLNRFLRLFINKLRKEDNL